MRVLPFASQRFDAVLLLFNSFGYFLPPRPAPAVSAKHELWKLPGVFYERGLVGEDSGVYRDTESDAAMNSGAGPAGAEDGNLAVLQEIARVLRCNGELMLEVANPRPLLAAVAHSPRRRMATRNYEIEEEYSYDPVARVLSNRTRFAVPGEGESAEYHIRLYPRAELCGLLRAAGFAVKRVCGSYEGENYHATRSPLILVHARRK
jgi:SAM-dependent methyltransferase